MTVPTIYLLNKFCRKRIFVHCFVFRSRRAKECRFQSQKIAPITGQPAWIAVDMDALTTGLTINFSNLKSPSIRYLAFTSNDWINLIEPFFDLRLWIFQHLTWKKKKYLINLCKFPQNVSKLFSSLIYWYSRVIILGL